MAINGGFAFFHRFPDRTVAEADITARTPILANFIQTVLASHSVTRRPIAIGFSNGAIMAAALLLTCPSLLAGAILFRPRSPFSHDLPTSLDGTPVLVIDGEKDSRRSPGDGLRLAERLIRAGAAVTHYVLRVGHPTRPLIEFRVSIVKPGSLRGDNGIGADFVWGVLKGCGKNRVCLLTTLHPTNAGLSHGGGDG